MTPRIAPWLLAALVLPAFAHAALPVPDNVTVEGIPEVPDELAAAVERYTNSRMAYLMDWHPDERQMLVGTRFAETTQVHHVAAPGAARRQLTFFDEPVAGVGYVPASGGQSLVFLRDVGGSEAYQLFRFDLADGGSTLLTDGASRHSHAVFNNAGDRFAYTSTRRNGQDSDVYVMDPQDPASARCVFEVEGSWWVADWSPDDSTLLVGRYISVNHSELFLVDLASGESRHLTKKKKRDPVAAYKRAMFHPDGMAIHVISDRGSQVMRLGTIDLDKGGYTAISPEASWDVSDMDLSDDGGLLAYVLNEGGRGALHLLDLASGEALDVPALPVGQVGNLEFRPGTHELSIWQSTDRTPGDVYSFEVGGELVRWTTSEVGGLNTDAFPTTEVLSYPTFDDVDGEARQIPLLMTMPDRERFPGLRPVLISIHGGPEGQRTPRFLGSWAYLVNELGVCLLQPNVRGSTGYGKEYRNLDNGRLREDSVRDISALLDWVGSHPDLDASQVAVYGGSYGGYMVLASLFHEPDRIRCGIDYVGISNFVTFLENTKPYRRDLRRVEYGDERDPQMREFLESISPTNHVDEIVVPLLVSQGANDPRVPASESDQMVAAIRGNGPDVWYLLASDEGHGFRKKGNRDYFQCVTFMFLERFLIVED
jgi:dipeptidyl aminopeptidase/acylaminoacyl peptidase